MQVQWYFESDNGFEKYDHEFNDLLESEYEKKKRFAEWTEEDGKKIKVDFKKMLEIDVKTGEESNVKRNVIGSVTFLLT